MCLIAQRDCVIYSQSRRIDGYNVCVCLEFLCEHWYKCVSFVPCVLINVKLSSNVSCHMMHRGPCAKEAMHYKPSATIRQCTTI